MLIGVPAVALLGVAIFAGWLSTGGGNRWLERRIESAVSNATEGGSFEIGQLALGPRGLRLDDVVLADADGRPIVTVDRLAADVHWHTLVEWHLSVPHLRAEGVVVELEADDEGVLDLVRLFGGPSTEPSTEPFELPVSLYLPDVQIVGGNLRYRTPEGTAFELAGLDLSGAVGGAGDRIVVSELDGTAQIAQPGPVAARIGGALAWDGSEGVSFDELVLAVPHGLAAVNGTVGETWDLGVRIDRLEARALDPFAGDAGLGGVWSGSVGLQGPPEALRATAALRGVERSEGAVALAATVDLTAPEPTWTATAELASFHVEDLYTPLEQDVVLEGVLTAEGRGLAFPGGVQADGRWRAGAMDVYGQQVESLDLRFGVSNGQLLIREDTVVDGVVGELAVEGRVDLQGGPVELDVSGTLDPEKLAALGASGLDGDGTFVAQIRSVPGAEGTTTRVTGTARYAPFLYGKDVRVDQLTVPFSITVEPERLRGTAGLRGTGATLYGLTAQELTSEEITFGRRPDGRVEAAGTVQLAPIAFGGQVGAGTATADFTFAQQGERRTVDAGVALTDWSLAGRPGTDGTVGVALVDDQVDFRVDLFDFGRLVLDTDGTFDLGTSELRVPNLAWAPTPRTTWTNQGPITLRLADGGVTDARVDLASDLGRIEVRGTLGAAGPLDGTVAVQGFQLDHVAELYPEQADGLAGALDLDLRLSGTAEAPVVDGEVDLRGLFAADSVRWLDVRGPFRVADGALAPDLALAVAGDPLAHLTGTIPLSGGLAEPGVDAQADALLRLDVVPGPLERFAHVAKSLDETELPEGRTSASVVLSGPLSDPGLRVAGVTEVAVPGWRLPGRVEFQAEREGGSLAISTDLREGLDLRATVAGGGATRMGEVFAGLTGAGPEVELSEPTLWLSDMTLAAVLLGVPVSSVVAASGSDVIARGELVGGFVVTGDPTRPVVEGAAQWLDPVLGEQALEGGYFEIVPAEAPAEGGAGPAEARRPEGLYAEGRREAGYAVRAYAGFPEGRALEVAGAAPVVIDLEKEWTEWSTGELDLAISGPRVPASIVSGSGLVHGIERVVGDVRIEGSVGGTLADPRPQVTVEAEDASLVWVHGGVELRDVDVLVEADRDHVDWDVSWEPRPLRNVAGALGRGIGEVTSEVGGGPPPRVRVWGEAALAEWRPTDVEAKVRFKDGPWLLATENEALRLSGNLGISGTWPELDVKGKLLLDEGSIEPTDVVLGDVAPLELSPELVVVRGAEARARPPDEPPLYADFDVDVKVDLQRNLQLELSIPFVDDLGALGAAVSRADLSARVGGEVEVTMAQGEPALEGEVKILEGSVRLLQSTFELVDGSTITWAGGDAYEDAVLDLQGEMNVGGATLTAHITGTPLEPVFDLSSDDYPDPEQQMVILLTGRAPEDLTAQEGQGANQALGALAGVLSGSKLGSFSIEPDGSVRLSIPVTPQLLVQTTLAPLNTDPNTNSLTFRAEYSPGRLPVVVSGAVGDRVTSGDVYWEIRF